MGSVNALARILDAELERCRVSRDNPVHRRLLDGEFTPAMLREWGNQHWLYTAAYPGHLCLVAAAAPSYAARGFVLTIAYEEYAGSEARPQSRLGQWEDVCAEFGLSPTELRRAAPLPTTTAMLATQECLARRSFVEGAAALLVGARGESAPYGSERRRALVERYGVSPEAAQFFGGSSDAGRASKTIQIIAPYVNSAESRDAVRFAVRRVLESRWEFFSGLGRAFGWSDDGCVPPS